ncbi:DNA/RNA non-specific endonuclease [Chitinivorax sp. PXF-14]|uniref:DNA/RNA non-specific endonuclease n=1 Tax=Chitinivorax sp. PXF-14 TaxID=3230488 RepID=UPI0034653FA1
MNQREIRTVVIPLEITLHIDGPGNATVSADLAPGLAAPALAAAAITPSAPPFDGDYEKRQGYDPDFLGARWRVGLPQLSSQLAQQAARLIHPRPDNSHILHYHHFSVVMHAERRFAVYSAANVSFTQRYSMNRPRDVWRIDPRIAASAQVGADYYADNQFDRGHLSRREDLEFGDTPLMALQSAADTNHFTNCTPQHKLFNQGKALWQGIERHILEDAILSGRFKAQVITGAVFDNADPLYRQLQYPLQFWKVVAAVNDKGTLFATAYLASQRDTIAQSGLEAAPALPFTPYRTFQLKIAEVERLTGLRFVCGAKDSKPLRQYDPLEHPLPPTASGNAPALAAGAAPVYIELHSLADIVR